MTGQTNIGKLRLAGFVIVSTCVHVALLSFHNSQRPFELGNSRQDIISVVMQNNLPARPTQENEHKPNHDKSIDKAEHGNIPQHTSTRAQEASGASSQRSRQAILGRLHQNIARYFYYPPQALRRGWEGTTLIHLRLLPNGMIDSISLAGSSGHAILDRAAMDSVERIHQLAMSDLNINTALEIQLPVTYRLRGG